MVRSRRLEAWSHTASLAGTIISVAPYIKPGDKRRMIDGLERAVKRQAGYGDMADDISVLQSAFEAMGAKKCEQQQSQPPS